MKNLVITLALMVGVTGMAQAKGDAAAGQTKAAVCAACHAPDGNSLVDMYPKIAGQHASYIKKQLVELKAAASGQTGRVAPIMGPMALPLSEQDMEDLAAYFSSQKVTPIAVPDDAVAAGKALYMGGDMSRGLAACTACHILVVPGSSRPSIQASPASTLPTSRPSSPPSGLPLVTTIRTA